MKKIKVFIRKTIYVIRKVLPAIVKEFNRKDGYIFKTNLDKKDIPVYEKISEIMGLDYRIDNSATDCYDRPAPWLCAFYVKGDYNWDKFMTLYRKYKER